MIKLDTLVKAISAAREVNRILGIPPNSNHGSTQLKQRLEVLSRDDEHSYEDRRALVAALDELDTAIGQLGSSTVS
jgi:hypothetical protein